MASRTLVCVARHIGARPNSSPHAIAVSSVTASTVPSTADLRRRRGRRCRSAAPAPASATPQSPGRRSRQPASTRLSTSNCRTRRVRSTRRPPAGPRTRAIDRTRATSSRLATLAQPISSTKIDPPSSNHNGRRASAKYWLRATPTGTRSRCWWRETRRRSARRSLCSSALAPAMMSPGASRATAHIRRLPRSAKFSSAEEFRRPFDRRPHDRRATLARRHVGERRRHHADHGEHAVLQPHSLPTIVRVRCRIPGARSPRSASTTSAAAAADRVIGS